MAPFEFSRCLLLLLASILCSVVSGLPRGFNHIREEVCPPHVGKCVRIMDCPIAFEHLRKGFSALRSRLCYLDNSGHPHICCERLPPKPRISRAKCDEYQSQLRNTSAKSCGHSPQGLIVGGTAARDFEFPHMAILGEKAPGGEMLWKCGGSLISLRWILTAAHCVNTNETLVVRLGEKDLDSSKDAAPEDYIISERVIHPEWRRENLRDGYHDLALARLDRQVRLRSIIQPACLPTDEDIPPPHTKATVAGWGTTREGKASPVLQKVRVPLMDPSKCEKLVKRYRLLKALYPRGVTGRILCAGAEEKDSCKGDSGGPLMIRRAHDSCQYEVLGIVSAGLGCGLPDIPGFYTEIPAYLDWIEGIVWERDP